MVDKALKDMTFEDFCRSVFNIKDTFHKPEVLKGIRAISTTQYILCLLYTSPSPRDGLLSRMPSSA